MKDLSRIAILSLAVLLLSCSPKESEEKIAAPEEPAPQVPTSNAEKLAYSLGYFLGEQLAQYPDLPTEFIGMGLSLGYEGAEPELELADMQSRVQEARRQASRERSREREARDAERQQLSAANKEKSRAWLQQNASVEGVETTASGLQYQVLAMGEGDSPQLSSRVTVHYTGTLIDGSKFDSSYDRDKPTTFLLSGVIPGWQEGLQLMNVGSKYRFFIPPELAYGERGSGASIGPNEALIFEVELLRFR